MSDVASTLENIKGIGPATRTAVLDQYPTLDSIDKASLEELEEVKGVGPATAKAIKAAVAKAEKQTAGTRSKAAAKEATTKSQKAGKQAGAQAKRNAKATSTSAKRNAKATGTAARKAASDVGTAGRKAATQIADAASDSVEGTVVELREARSRVGDQADNAAQQVKAAFTSIQNILTAALEAGRESLPEAQRQVKAASTSVRKLGPSVVEALEKLREDRKTDKGA